MVLYPPSVKRAYKQINRRISYTWSVVAERTKTDLQKIGSSVDQRRIATQPCSPIRRVAWY